MASLSKVSKHFRSNSFPPHSSPVCVVLWRQRGPEASIDQQDDDGDGWVSQRNAASSCCVFLSLIGWNAGRGRGDTLRGRGWKREARVRIFLWFLTSDVSVIPLACLTLTFFLWALLLFPAVLLLLLLALRHQGSRGQYHVSVRVPQSLTTEQGILITWEAPPHVGVVLHAVQVHDWVTNRSNSVSESFQKLIMESSSINDSIIVFQYFSFCIHQWIFILYSPVKILQHVQQQNLLQVKLTESLNLRLFNWDYRILMLKTQTCFICLALSLYNTLSKNSCAGKLFFVFSFGHFCPGNPFCRFVFVTLLSTLFHAFLIVFSPVGLKQLIG